MGSKKEKDLIKLLTTGYRYQTSELFRWMLEDALSRMRAPVHKTFDKEALPLIQQCTDLYFQVVHENPPFTDCLGPIYMEVASSGTAKKKMGQFFTPQSIATMLAMMVGAHEKKHEPGQLTMMNDPACGSGVMLLSILGLVLRERGREDLLNWSVSGTDLDRICALMCAVQLLANCCIHDMKIGEILINQGDSLGPRDALQVILFGVANLDPEPKYIRLDIPEIEVADPATEEEVLEPLPESSAVNPV